MRPIVQLYGDTVCPADWRVEGVFDFCRFYWVKGGKAAYSGADGTYGLRRGSLYVFPCNVPYRISHDPDEPLDVVWFHVSLLAGRTARPVEICIGEDTLPHHLLLSLMHGMKESASMVERLFGILFDALAPALSRPATPSGKIAEVLGRISSSPGEAYTNKRLAGMLGYSEKHFIRFFQKHVGTQPHRYVTALRMGTAVKHLVNGMSVKETAEMLGYGSASNFSRDFRLHYRMSPTEYIAAYSHRP